MPVYQRIVHGKYSRVETLEEPRVLQNLADCHPCFRVWIEKASQHILHSGRVDSVVGQLKMCITHSLQKSSVSSYTIVTLRHIHASDYRTISSSSFKQQRDAARSYGEVSWILSVAICSCVWAVSVHQRRMKYQGGVVARQ